MIKKSVIQSLLDISLSSRSKSTAGKCKILKNGRLCPSSSKVKFSGKEKRKQKFILNDQNVRDTDSSFHFSLLRTMVVWNHIYIFVYLQNHHYSTDIKKIRFTHFTANFPTTANSLLLLLRQTDLDGLSLLMEA